MFGNDEPGSGDHGVRRRRHGPPKWTPHRRSTPSPSTRMAPPSPVSSRWTCLRRQTLIAKDFPLSLDTSSLRVEGEAGAKLTIGTIDARPPRAAPPVNLPELDKRIEALKDQRADLQGAIDCGHRAAQIRAALCRSVARRPRREGRGAADHRMARSVYRGRPRKSRPPNRDPRRHAKAARDRSADRATRSRAQAKPPSKLEVRIDVAAPAATKATLRVTYTVRNARWLPLYDARLDTGAKDRKPQLELVRRAEVTQSTGEDWSNVALGVSTVRIGRGGSAPELNSLVVRYPQLPKPLALGAASDSAMPARQPMQRQVETPAAWRKAAERCCEARRRAAGRCRDRRVSGHVQDSRPRQPRRRRGRQEPAHRLGDRRRPICGARGAGRWTRPRSSKPRSSRPRIRRCCRARVAIYRDGIFVGRGQMSLPRKDETVRLGFGADDKVKIERAVVKRRTKARPA